MPHMIELRSNADGTFGAGEMFSVRQRPWHGLGIILNDYPTTREAIVAAGLAFHVGTEQIRTDGGEIIQGFKRTLRADTGATLGIVGNDWVPIQNDKLFELAEAISGTDEAKWETAGSLEGGKRVWALMRLDRTLYVAGEALDPFFLVSVGHNGKFALQARCTPIRVVCNNTFTAAFGSDRKLRTGTFSVHHSKNYESLIGEAARSLNLVKHFNETFEQFANKLATKLFSEAQFEDMLKTLIPIDDDATPRKRTNTLNVREAILECRKAPDLNNIRDTQWGALNAWGDFSDHHARTKKTGDWEGRAYSNTFERTKLKDRALSYLMAVN